MNNIKCNSWLSQLLGLILVMCMLAGCNDKPCVEADDFGFSKMEINAKGQNVRGKFQDQYSEWQDASLVVTGSERLVVVVSRFEDSGWTSWFGKSDQEIESIKKIECTFENNNMCPDPTAKYAPINNAPCMFRGGVGAYMLVTNPDSPTHPDDPNANRRSMLDPATFIQANSYHLGQDLAANSSYGQPTGGINMLPQNVPTAPGASPSGFKPGGRIYLKIMDNFYEDNYGKYRIMFKSGVDKPYPGGIGFVVKSIVGQLEIAATDIYKALVVDSNFINYVTLALVLYIMLMSLGMMFGLFQISNAEIVKRILKFAVVAAVISPMSWSFFNENVFVLFREGVRQVGSFITATAPGDAYRFFDYMLEILGSREVNIKVLSILIPQPGEGILFIIAFYVTFVVLAFAMIKAAMYYCLSVIAVQILIILAPFFIVFMLFAFTKEFFDRWVTQMISYALQAILIFASIAFIGEIILQVLHDLLGFTVCWRTWLKIPLINLEFKFWLPTNSITMGDIGVNPFKTIIWVPEAMIDAANNYFAPFSWQQERYIDLPFLEPMNMATGELNDNDRIADIFSGNYISMGDIFVFSALVYLLFEFNSVVPQLAKAIAGNAMSFADMDMVVNSMWQDISGTNNVLWRSIGVHSAVENFRTQAYNRVMGGLESVRAATFGQIATPIHNVIDNLPGIKQYNAFEEAAKKGHEINARGIGNIGVKFDAVNDARSAMTDHAISGATGGLFGKNMYEQKETHDQWDNVRTKRSMLDMQFTNQSGDPTKLGYSQAELVNRKLRAAFNLNDAQAERLDEGMRRMNGQVPGIGQWGGAALAASFFVAPGAGLAILGVGVGAKGFAYFNEMRETYRDVKALEDGARPGLGGGAGGGAGGLGDLRETMDPLVEERFQQELALLEKYKELRGEAPYKEFNEELRLLEELRGKEQANLLKMDHDFQQKQVEQGEALDRGHNSAIDAASKVYDARMAEIEAQFKGQSSALQKELYDGAQAGAANMKAYQQDMEKAIQTRDSAIDQARIQKMQAIAAADASYAEGMKGMSQQLSDQQQSMAEHNKAMADNYAQQKAALDARVKDFQSKESQFFASEMQDVMKRKQEFSAAMKDLKENHQAEYDHLVKEHNQAKSAQEQHFQEQVASLDTAYNLQIEGIKEAGDLSTLSESDVKIVYEREKAQLERTHDLQKEAEANNFREKAVALEKSFKQDAHFEGPAMKQAKQHLQEQAEATLNAYTPGGEDTVATGLSGTFDALSQNQAEAKMVMERQHQEDAGKLADAVASGSMDAETFAKEMAQLHANEQLNLHAVNQKYESDKLEVAHGKQLHDLEAGYKKELESLDHDALAHKQAIFADDSLNSSQKEAAIRADEAAIIQQKKDLEADYKANLAKENTHYAEQKSYIEKPQAAIDSENEALYKKAYDQVTTAHQETLAEINKSFDTPPGEKKVRFADEVESARAAKLKEAQEAYKEQLGNLDKVVDENRGQYKEELAGGRIEEAKKVMHTAVTQAYKDMEAHPFKKVDQEEYGKERDQNEEEHNKAVEKHKEERNETAEMITQAHESRMKEIEDSGMTAADKKVASLEQEDAFAKQMLQLEKEVQEVQAKDEYEYQKHKAETDHKQALEEIENDRDKAMRQLEHDRLQHQQEIYNRDNQTAIQKEATKQQDDINYDKRKAELTKEFDDKLKAENTAHVQRLETIAKPPEVREHNEGHYKMAIKDVQATHEGRVAELDRSYESAKAQHADLVEKDLTELKSKDLDEAGYRAAQETLMENAQKEAEALDAGYQRSIEKEAKIYHDELNHLDERVEQKSDIYDRTQEAIETEYQGALQRENEHYQFDKESLQQELETDKAALESIKDEIPEEEFNANMDQLTSSIKEREEALEVEHKTVLDAIEKAHEDQIDHVADKLHEEEVKLAQEKEAAALQAEKAQVEAELAAARTEAEKKRAMTKKSGVEKKESAYEKALKNAEDKKKKDAKASIYDNFEEKKKKEKKKKFNPKTGQYEDE